MPLTNNLASSTSRIRPLVNYLNKQKQNQNFYQTIELNATIFLIIFFVIFAIRPTVMTISSLVGEIKAKETQKTLLKTKINQIIKAQDQYSLVQGRYSVIDQSLPDRPAYYDIANQIISISNESNNPLSELSFNLPKTNNLQDHVNNYSVPLKITGNFKNSVAILNQLLQNRRLIGIPSVTFSIPKTSISPIGTGSATITGNIVTSINTNIYFWEQNNGKN